MYVYRAKHSRMPCILEHKSLLQTSCPRTLAKLVSLTNPDLGVYVWQLVWSLRDIDTHEYRVRDRVDMSLVQPLCLVHVPQCMGVPHIHAFTTTQSWRQDGASSVIHAGSYFWTTSETGLRVVFQGSSSPTTRSSVPDSRPLLFSLVLFLGP